jgi:hypothetical protein
MQEGMRCDEKGRFEGRGVEERAGGRGGQCRSDST